MKIVPTQINRQYVLTTGSTCTATTDKGILLCTATAGEQKIFTAISAHVELSDDDAILSLLFGKFTENNARDTIRPLVSGKLPHNIQAGYVYDLGELTDNTDLSNLKFSGDNGVQTSELWFSIGRTIPLIIWPSDAVWIKDAVPFITPSTAYRLAVRCEPNGILIFNLAYEYSL